MKIKYDANLMIEFPYFLFLFIFVQIGFFSLFFF